MVRDVVDVARTTAVHARGAAEALIEQFPGRPIEYLTLGEGQDDLPTDEDRMKTRRELGLSANGVAFGLFGGLTAEKRLPEVLRAFRACLAVQPAARLLLAGRADPSVDWRGLSRAAGVEAAVMFVGVLEDDAFDRAIAAVDVSLNLRWPTALETSGPWLRALAAGRATVVMDLAHQTHVPSVDPRTWQPTLPSASTAPITVAIDVLDEAHSLGVAFRRLATDPALREALGSAGRRYWERHHRLARMRDEYLDLIARTAVQPAFRTPVPPGLGYDPLAHTRALVAEFGDLSCELF
jgi:glycosyltransferase involved in cell wall biosynthesis